MVQEKSRSQNSSPSVLVCVACYHRLDMLKDALASLLKQSYGNFEAWIIKDGCASACSFRPNYVTRTCLECEKCQEVATYCREFVKTDSRFRFIILNVNFSGRGWGPRNYALLNSEHEFVAYLDDDNWYEPDHLECMVHAITSTNAGMAYTGSKVWRDGKLLGERLKVQPPQYGWIDTSEIMHRRELIFQYGGWRDDRDPVCEKRVNDWDLVKRWMDNNVTWAHTGKITMNYTQPLPPWKYRLKIALKKLFVPGFEPPPYL